MTEEARQITPCTVVEAKYGPGFPNSFGEGYAAILRRHPQWAGIDSETAMSLAYQTSDLMERNVLNLLASEAASREDAAWRAQKGREPRVAEADMHVRDEPKRLTETRTQPTTPVIEKHSPPCSIGGIESVLENYISELGPVSGFNCQAILALNAKMLDFRSACEWVVGQMHMGKPVHNPPAMVYTTLRRMMMR